MIKAILSTTLHLEYSSNDRFGRSAMIRLSPRLCRAARALAGFEQKHLAEASGVSKSTIGAFEIKGETARLATMNNRALIEAFEQAGLQFVEENGGGHGVRLQRPRSR
jgi:DNA-binding XRE family transcriptional regulator